jgi:hypothetical protein
LDSENDGGLGVEMEYGEARRKTEQGVPLHHPPLKVECPHEQVGIEVG